MINDDTLHPKYLTPAELARRWKVTTMTLRRWRKAGHLRSVHIGRRIRFSITEIERYEREAEV